MLPVLPASFKPVNILGGKTRSIAIHLAKQVARFRCPFYRTQLPLRCFDIVQFSEATPIFFNRFKSLSINRYQIFTND